MAKTAPASGQRRRPKPAKARPPTTGRLALADAVATAVFVVATVAVSHLSTWAAPLLDLSPAGAGLALIIMLLILMSYFCDWLGGALFNPANSAFMWATGQGSGRSHIVRSVAQTLGGLTGALLAAALLPPEWTTGMRGMAVGVRPGVSLLGGAACEFVLGSLLAFLVLWCGEQDSRVLRLWLPLLSTVVAVKAGEDVTGPSLNPAFTFSFVFLHPLQSPLEHAFVFWVAPVAAGVFGGWAFLGWQQFAALNHRKQQRQKAD